MLSKKILFPSLAVVIVGASAFGITRVDAQSSVIPLSGLAQAIAQKFNLNQSDVQSVVNDWHGHRVAMRQDKMKEHLSTKLDALVKEGKLTTAQKQAVLDKFAQLKSGVQNTDFKNLTPEERKAEMDKRKADLEAWAKSEGIDLTVLRGLLGGPRMGFRGFGHRLMNSPTPTP